MSDPGGPSEGFHSPIRPNDGFNPYLRPTVPPLPPPTRPAKRGNGISSFLVAVIVGAIVIGVGVVAFWAIRANTPEEAVKDLVHDAYARDSRGVCGSLARANLEKFEHEGTSCKKELDEIFAAIDAPGYTAPPTPCSPSAVPNRTSRSVL